MGNHLSWLAIPGTGRTGRVIIRGTSYFNFGKHFILVPRIVTIQSKWRFTNVMALTNSVRLTFFVGAMV